MPSSLVSKLSFDLTKTVTLAAVWMSYVSFNLSELSHCRYVEAGIILKEKFGYGRHKGFLLLR